MLKQEQERLENEQMKIDEAVSTVKKTFLNELYSLRPVQTQRKLCWAKNVARYWTKILSKFKSKPTTSNAMLRRGQNVVSDNGRWCWTNVLASFQQALK